MPHAKTHKAFQLKNLQSVKAIGRTDDHGVVLFKIAVAPSAFPANLNVDGEDVRFLWSSLVFFSHLNSDNTDRIRAVLRLETFNFEGCEAVSVDG